MTVDPAVTNSTGLALDLAGVLLLFKVRAAERCDAEVAGDRVESD